ncbi:hypothetical protein MHH33_07070 [Paenisporosarcina sp. FSL H8-0542]|uniref:hypothetical protein n=1 Tax=Paenisporosarcina sp. FSL H8-0542 TaxID=2921401 RepID=UPI00315AB64E
MAYIQRLNVDSFLTVIGKDTPAVSEPIKVLCDDNNSYILKTDQIFDETSKTYLHFDCTFVNEFLSYCIAKHIGVPTPEAAIANVDKDFIDANLFLKFQGRFSEGDHFASFFLEKCEGNLMEDYLTLHTEGKSHLKKPWNKFFGDLGNPEDIPLIICFDLLIANFDRFRHSSNLLVQNDDNRRIFVIDQGHAFNGPYWNTSKASIRQMQGLPSHEYITGYTNLHFLHNQQSRAQGIFNLSGFGDIFRALDNYIDVSDINNHSFIEPIKRIKTIDAKLITDWLNDIPDSWYVNKPVQVDFYRSFLLTQIQFMPGIIQHMANTSAFGSRTGGILSWNAQSTGTQ